MGMKSIEKKQTELSEKRNTVTKFVRICDKLDGSIGILEDRARALIKGQSDLSKMYKKVATSAKAIETDGQPAFDAYKRKLVEYCEDPFRGDEPPRARDLKNVIKLYQNEIDEEMDKWIKKQEGAWPKEIKKGMCFKWYTTGVVIEITSDAKKATNKTLKGDDAIYWEAKQQDGKPYTSVKKSFLTPKNKWKFIKT